MSLFSSLRSSADAIRVFEKSLEVVQNNVSNVSTPGYARQIQDVISLPFDPATGLSGGIRAMSLTSTRNEFAEQAVRRQVERQGHLEQRSTSLAPIEGVFDVSGESGISAALSDLLKSFSAWGASSNDGAARQVVLNEAQGVADAFNTAAQTLQQATQDTETQIRGTVDQINTLAARVRDFNEGHRDAQGSDAGMDANMHATLEELSQLVNITVLQQPDGSMTVLLGGQTPLVVGENQYLVHTTINTPNDTPPAHLIDSAGRDITSRVTDGKLAGLFDVRNETLVGLMGNSAQTGELNRMATAFADRVNALLTGGNISDASTAEDGTVTPAVTGVPLFTYNTTNPAWSALTLAVNPDITASQLAAIDPGPPSVANGTALKLAGLAQPEDAADKIDGVSFTEFYGNIAAEIGATVSGTDAALDTQRGMVTQAQDFREQVSGVSLDDEAVRVIQYQRSYEAAAKMVSVLNELTQTLLNML